MTVLPPATHGSVSEVGAASAPAAPVQQVRAMLATALLVVLTGYLAAAALTAVVLWSAGSEFSFGAAFNGAGPLWLAANHVPLSVRGAPLGVLPLLFTVLVMWLVAKMVAAMAARLRLDNSVDAVRVIGTTAGTHAVAGAALAAVGSGSFTASPAAAFFGCGLFSGMAATIGLARRCGLLQLLRSRVGTVVYRGLQAGVLATAALLAAGAVVVAFSLVLSFDEVRASFPRAGIGFGGAFGLTLLSLGYLPNAVFAGLSFVVGPGFSVGQVAVSPLRVVGGELPAMPLLALLPETTNRWWLLGLALPIGAGVLVGWTFRNCAPWPKERVLVVTVAAVVAAVASFILTGLAGGRLGAGAFDPVAVPAGLVAVLAFCWIWLPGAAVAWVTGLKPEPDLLEEQPEPAADADEVFDAEAAELAEDAEDADEPGEEADELSDEADEVSDEADEVLDEDAEPAEADPEEPAADEPDEAEPAEIEPAAEADDEPDSERPAAGK